MFISKRPQKNGFYGILIFTVSLLIWVSVVDYSEEYDIYYFFGGVCLFFLSFYIENKIVKSSEERYEELKNDVKEDILREVLEELEDKK